MRRRRWKLNDNSEKQRKLLWDDMEWELKNGSDKIKKRRQKITPCMQQQHLNIPPPPTGEIDETICCFVIFKTKKARSWLDAWRDVAHKGRLEKSSCINCWVNRSNMLKASEAFRFYTLKDYWERGWVVPEWWYLKELKLSALQNTQHQTRLTHHGN